MLAVASGFGWLVSWLFQGFKPGPIAKLLIPRAYATVMDAMDPIMPELIARMTPRELETDIRRRLSAATGQDWSRRDIEAFWQLWDLRIAAGKAKPKG